MSISEASGFDVALVRSLTDTHKRSMLVVLVLLRLHSRPAWSQEIAAFLQEVSDGHLGVDEQSLHRALRSMLSHNLVLTTPQPVRGTGANRKIYELTATGERTLRRFLTTTMSYMHHPEFLALVTGVVSNDDDENAR